MIYKDKFKMSKNSKLEKGLLTTSTLAIVISFFAGYTGITGHAVSNSGASGLTLLSVILFVLGMLGIYFVVKDKEEN